MIDDQIKTNPTEIEKWRLRFAWTKVAEFKAAVRAVHQISERAPDVRAVPMRLVHQSAFDALLALVADHSR